MGFGLNRTAMQPLSACKAPDDNASRTSTGSKGSKGSWFSRKSGADDDSKAAECKLKANEPLPKDALKQHRESTGSTVASSSVNGDKRRSKGAASSGSSVVSALSTDSSRRSGRKR